MHEGVDHFLVHGEAAVKYVARKRARKLFIYVPKVADVHHAVIREEYQCLLAQQDRVIDIERMLRVSDKHHREVV